MSGIGPVRSKIRGMGMKGVILAGGRGTRLHPLTEITNKHLLPVGREPMIWHAVKQLVGAGIDDIMVVTSTHHMGDIVNSLGSGERFGCAFTYRVQESAGGVAHALDLARGFAGGERMAVFLGDNIFEYSIKPYADNFRRQKAGAKVLLKEVAEPTKFGVAALDEGQIMSIAEKPGQPATNYAVVGCYFYDERAFDFIDRIEPSDRGELEITAVNNLYISDSVLSHDFVHGRWTDAGTFDSLLEANAILLDTANRISDRPAD
jgi:glucose-1-phosphate thymidylyltransferase